MINFKNIEYLKTGNKRQKEAYFILKEIDIFNLLADYSAILTGTIPIEIDLPESDLDIICTCKNHETYTADVQYHYQHFKHFQIHKRKFQNTESTIISFDADTFKIELFGQNMTVEQQHAYKHMIIEHQILIKQGNGFKREIIQLKKNGLTTEEAFAKRLGIKGDPYIELLKYKI